MENESLELVPMETDKAGAGLITGAPDAGLSMQGKYRVLGEQVRHLYGRASRALCAEILLAALSGFVLWSRVPSAFLFSMLGVIAAIALARVLLVSGYFHAHPKPEQAARWKHHFAIGALASGLSWGIGGLVVMLLDNPAERLLVLFILGAVGISSYVSMISSVGIFALNAVPLFLPISAWFAMQGDHLHGSAALLTLLSCTLLVASARSVNTHTERSVTLAASNTDLIRKLVTTKDQSERAKQSAERANSALKKEVSERERAERKIRESERELSAILHNLHDTIFRTDHDGLFTWLSPSVRSLLGYTQQQLLGTPMSALHVSAEDNARLHALLQERKSVDNFETQLAREDGSRIWVSVDIHYYRDPEGSVAGMEGSLRNITLRRLAQHELFTEKEKAQVTLSSIGDGVITTDVNGIIDYINPVAEQATGWSTSNASGQPHTNVLRLVDEVSGETFADPVLRCITEDRVVKPGGHPLLLGRDEKTSFSVELSVAPIRNESGVTIGTVLVFHDVTELRGLARQMSYQATHDALSGLINRAEFERRVEQALVNCRNEAMGHAICFMDLDRFKIVNDTCGHAAGDELLRQLSAELRSSLREADTLARLGGDEFGALLEGCSMENALTIAETLRSVVENFRFLWDDKTFRVGVSIGLVPINQYSGTMTDVLSTADAACYVAKDSGRNQVHVWKPDDQAMNEHKGQVQWVRRIQDALETDRFVLFMQPILPAKETLEKKRWGELLLRMVDPEGHLVMPGAFLPAAERYQMMPAIEHWVLENSLSLMQRPDNPLGTLELCTINICPQCLFDKRHQKYILDTVTSSGVDPSRLCFDIPENSIIANPAGITHFIAELADLGCSIALDDFGSGLMSFAYLKNVRLSYLKLDGSFVQNMCDDRLDHAIVTAIHQIAGVMNLETIAERVECDKTLEKLRMMDIDYVQGFNVAPATPVLAPPGVVTGELEAAACG